MAIKKKLVVKYDFDFRLYGLITPAKEYKLAWLLNKRTGFNLVKQDEIIIEFISSEKLFISNYLYETEHNMVRLVRNKAYTDQSDNQLYLIPELNRFDYLLLIKGNLRDISEKDLVSTLKEIPDIQYISYFEIDQLKSRDNLIFS